MTTLPIAFVVALLLIILVATQFHALRQTSAGRMFLWVLILYALSMVLIGARWTWNIVNVMPAVAALAVATSALLYLAFKRLGRDAPAVSLTRDWIHLILIVLVVLSALFFRDAMDPLIAATKLLYAGLMLLMARKGPESLGLVRIGMLANTSRALWWVAFLLVVSALLDIAIAIDFGFYEGRHAAHLVGLVNLLLLAPLAWLAVVAGRGGVREHVAEAPGVGTPPAPATGPNEDDHSQLMARLRTLLIDQTLYADPDLNLQRLARKAGVPARAVSRAVNASTGQNVSQWVNAARIEQVCERLADSNMSITDAMHASGFSTKSNFNREFRRIKGCSPSEWREQRS